jgi:hypothetical protein
MSFGLILEKRWGKGKIYMEETLKKKGFYIFIQKGN